MTLFPEATRFIATCDIAGHLRGRAVAFSEPQEDTSVGWVPANIAIDAFGHLVEPNAFGSVGDLRLQPAGETLILNGSSNLAQVSVQMADQVNLDGTPWACCPRSFLSSALRELETVHEVHMVASFEHEFHLFDSPERPPFSLQAMRDAEPFGSTLLSTLRVSGFEPENWLAEFGAGQYEITLRPAEALTAADRAVLLREAVRDVATQTGRRASFAPMVNPEGSGNGVHVHFSFVDAKSGAPVLFDPNTPGKLSSWGSCFAQGILMHAGALCALSAASPGSYLRLVPQHWSSAAAYLAVQDREAMVRVCGTGGSDERAAGRLNLEFRAGDATANPYLALGGLIRAGMSGLESNVPARVWTEPLTSDELNSTVQLPRSFAAALDDLEGDPIARSWLSPTLLSTYLAVKRSECEAVAGLNDTEICRRISDVF